MKGCKHPAGSVSRQKRLPHHTLCSPRCLEKADLEYLSNTAGHVTVQVEPIHPDLKQFGTDVERIEMKFSEFPDGLKQEGGEPSSFSRAPTSTSLLHQHPLRSSWKSIQGRCCTFPLRGGTKSPPPPTTKKVMSTWCSTTGSTFLMGWGISKNLIDMKPSGGS